MRARPLALLFLLLVRLEASRAAETRGSRYVVAKARTCTGVGSEVAVRGGPVGCAASCLRVAHCVAFVWTGARRSCRLLPVLLRPADMHSGNCAYFVHSSCRRTGPGCRTEFNICLRAAPERRFHLTTGTKRTWRGNERYCVGRGGHLAEFPSKQVAAMGHYFPVASAMLRQKIIPLSDCNQWGPGNVQHQAFIGSELRGGKHVWVRNGSEVGHRLGISVSYTVTATASSLSFTIFTQAALRTQRYALKGQFSNHTQQGLCECRLQ